MCVLGGGGVACTPRTWKYLQERPGGSRTNPFSFSEEPSLASVPPLVDAAAACSNSIILQTFPFLALFFQMIKYTNLYTELACGWRCPNTLARVILINPKNINHHVTDKEAKELEVDGKCHHCKGWRQAAQHRRPCHQPCEALGDTRLFSIKRAEVLLWQEAGYSFSYGENSQGREIRVCFHHWPFLWDVRPFNQPARSHL